MGVNHFGEMRRLSSVASPDICVITNIGVAHLEFFKTREGILQEKSKMIQDMKNGGTIILNGDDDLLSQMEPVKGATPILWTGENCQFQLQHSAPGLKGTRCTIHLPLETPLLRRSPARRPHDLQCIGRRGCRHTLYLTSEEIKAGIEGFPPSRTEHLIQTDSPNDPGRLLQCQSGLHQSRDRRARLI